MVELRGIESLMIQTPEMEEPLTSRSSLEALQTQLKEKEQLSEWLSIMKKTQQQLDSMEEGNVQSHTLLHEFEKVQSPMPKLNAEIKDSGIKIDFDDIQSEIEYWNSSVVCYVLGANPPFSMMEGYIRRI